MAVQGSPRSITSQHNRRVTMDIQALHQLIDDWAAKQPSATVTFGTPVPDSEIPPQEEPKRELPKDKRVIRTKSTGDRVYLIDETAKTKAWVTSAEILEKLGFTMADVEEVE